MDAPALLGVILRGVLLGGLYALNGLSLTLVFGVMKLINLSHGHFVILGSFFAYYLFTSYNIDPILSLVFGLPAMFVIGFAFQFYLLNRVHRISMEAPLLVTFGVSIIVLNTMLVWYSTYPRALVTSYTLVSLDLGFTIIPLIYLINFAAALIVMGGLHAFLGRTYMGRAIRASASNDTAALLMGINTDRIYAFTFAISMAIAAVTGVFVGLIWPFDPSHGSSYLIVAFFVLVVGGMGNVLGAFLVGILFGVFQTTLGHIVGVGYQQFATYLLLFLILAVRPQGFFGAKGG